MKENQLEEEYTYLIGESDTEPEQDPTHDQHPNVLGEAIDECTDEEENTSEQHGEFPTELTRDG